MHKGVKHDTPQTTAQDQDTIDALKAGVIQADNINTSGNSTTSSNSTTIVKLSRATAKTLLEKARVDNQYLPKITEADITEFINNWDKAYKDQIPSTSSSSSHTEKNKGSGETGSTANSDSDTTTKYASALDPVSFASDFI